MTKEDKAKLKDQISNLVNIKNKSKLVTALTHYFEDKQDDEFEYKINLASEFYEANLSTFKEAGQTSLNYLLEMFLDDQLAINTETKEILIEDGCFYAKAPGVDIPFTPDNIEERLNMMAHMSSSNGGTIKDIIDDNIVKQTCKELGMTYKQLGELIGYSEPAIKKAAQTNTISEPMQKAIELYKEVLTLKLKLLNTNKLKKALKELLE
ncbi:hypothetical protein [Sulfuricurvum sp.]|uniref:hypothetical protein n=1 Tax=Sulfuricurvum sp. TaxID=2025608 RepID=UPI003BB0AE06